MSNQLKKLWEDMKTNIKIKKGISEGKITKYDATLLDKIKPYDYYNVPMLVYLLNPSLGNYSHEISLVLASILANETSVFLLKVPYLDYYLIEVTINNKKYIYDISKGLVYNEEYYFYLNPNSNYEKIIFTKDIATNLVSNDFLMPVENSSKIRNNLVAIVLEDYKNGVYSSVKMLLTLDKYLKAKEERIKLERIKNFKF